MLFEQFRELLVEGGDFGFQGHNDGNYTFGRGEYVKKNPKIDAMNQIPEAITPFLIPSEKMNLDLLRFPE
jgi:hypothetical protein